MKHFLFLIIILLAAPLTAQQNDVWSRWKGELPPPGVSQRFGNTPYDRYQAQHPEPKLTPGEALLLIDILRPRQRDFSRVNRSAFTHSGFAFNDFSDVVVVDTSRRGGHITHHDFSHGLSGIDGKQLGRELLAKARSHRVGYIYSDLESLSGTSSRIGSTTFHDFSNGVSGTSWRAGSTTFHDFSNGVTGTSSRIGDTVFHRFSTR